MTRELAQHKRHVQRAGVGNQVKPLICLLVGVPWTPNTDCAFYFSIYLWFSFIANLVMPPYMERSQKGGKKGKQLK
jgi:hypothetical protein